MNIALRNQLTVLLVLVFLATLFVSPNFAQSSSSDAKPAAQSGSEVKLPDTPAGKTFAAFLKAFNSGDIEVMKKFHAEHAGNPENAQKDMDFYQQSGGIKVVSVGKSSDYALEVIIETKTGGRQLSFAIEVDSQSPYGIQSIHVQPA
jgi:hypothetical protein